MTQAQQKRIDDLEDEVRRLRGLIEAMGKVVDCAKLIPLRNSRRRA